MLATSAGLAMSRIAPRTRLQKPLGCSLLGRRMEHRTAPPGATALTRTPVRGVFDEGDRGQVHHPGLRRPVRSDADEPVDTGRGQECRRLRRSAGPLRVQQYSRDLQETSRSGSYDEPVPLRRSSRCESANEWTTRGVDETGRLRSEPHQPRTRRVELHMVADDRPCPRRRSHRRPRPRPGDEWISYGPADGGPMEVRLVSEECSKAVRWRWWAAPYPGPWVPRGRRSGYHPTDEQPKQPVRQTRQPTTGEREVRRNRW